MGVGKAYSSELVDVYDMRHFGGRSGRHILEKDCRVIESLLPGPGSLILDIPCGTGIYAEQFSKKGYRVVAADASLPMLEIVSRRGLRNSRLQCDIHHLPYGDDSIDSVMTIRLFSHYEREDVTRILKELKRVIRPQGFIVFDSFRWSPRKWPIFRSVLEESYIVTISRKEMEETITSVGLKVVRSESRYLFSPIWQRRLPIWFLTRLSALESKLPQPWLLRTFWVCTKE